MGRMGDVGVFSFNYYKNMTAGEGGGGVTNNDVFAERVKCAIDPCHFYWHGRSDELKPFAGNGARATEFMGAMMNVQLDRLDGRIGAMRAERDEILRGIAPLDNLGLRPAPLNSEKHDCATQAVLTPPPHTAAK